MAQVYDGGAIQVLQDFSVSTPCNERTVIPPFVSDSKDTTLRTSNEYPQQ